MESYLVGFWVHQLSHDQTFESFDGLGSLVRSMSLLFLASFLHRMLLGFEKFLELCHFSVAHIPIILIDLNRRLPEGDRGSVHRCNRSGRILGNPDLGPVKKFLS